LLVPAIEIHDLHKTYGDTRAVAGVSLTVGEGEVVALLGPNGAGKTTTVEILEGHRDRDSGEVRVLGVDPRRAGREFRERIGIVLQSSGVDGVLTVEETVRLYAGLYPRPRPAGEVIGLVGLTEKAGSRIKTLSGGQRRRLDLALGIVGDPDLVFLDEPTTGFDPSARRRSWGLIDALRGLGKTILLTTHFMDEAQVLADRVVVMVGGRIVADASPETVGGRADGAARVGFRLPPGTGPADLPAPFTGAAVEAGRVEAAIDHPTEALHALTAWAVERGIELAALEVIRPSLEDVYLALTGEDGDG
jgi:ABC-2 type transport system ATP-binding protein